MRPLIRENEKESVGKAVLVFLGAGTLLVLVPFILLKLILGG